MPRNAIAQIGSLLRAQLGVSIALRTLAEDFDYTRRESGRLLAEAMKAQASAIAGQLSAAKATFVASAELPTLGGYDATVTAGGWADEAEEELGRLQEAASTLNICCVLKQQET